MPEGSICYGQTELWIASGINIIIIISIFALLGYLVRKIRQLPSRKK